MRQLKPHSLSYQLTTFAHSPPSIAVDGASTIDECGSLLKSEETSSSWLTARMPRSSPLAASSKAALMSCTVVVLDSCTDRAPTGPASIGPRGRRPASVGARGGAAVHPAPLPPAAVGTVVCAAAR